MSEPKLRADRFEDVILLLTGLGIVVLVTGFALMLVWLAITSLLA